MSSNRLTLEAYWTAPEPAVQEMPTGRCEACSRITYTKFRADSVLGELFRPKRLVIGSFSYVVNSAFAGCYVCRIIMIHIVQSFTHFSQLITCYDIIKKIALSLSLDDDLSLHCWDDEEHEVQLSDLSVAGVIELRDDILDHSQDLSKESDVAKIVIGGLHWIPNENASPPRLLQCDANRLKLNPSVEMQPLLLHHWLTDCIKNHSSCCSAMDETATQLPTRVLDVGEVISSRQTRLLVTEGLAAPYLTLSHCWGNTDHTMALSQATFDSFVAGISDDKMPKVFHEAILLTRNLGYRYLWIDSMCIMQPTAIDKDDWNREGTRMGQYYSRSALNIAASAAMDNTEGLLHARAGSQFEVKPFPLFEKPVHREWDEFSKIMNRDPNWLPIMQPKPASWLHHVQKSPLNSRAWVLQERLLAPRTLHCTMQGFFWECSELRASEYEPLGCGRDFDTRDHGLLNLRQLQKRDDMFMTGSYWRHIVEAFSQLEISFPCDRLPALSGLAQSISEHTKTRYIAGHFESSLIGSLLWFRLDSNLAEVQVRNLGAPSWSWASTSAPVKFTSLEARDYPSRSVDEYEWKAEILKISAKPEGVNPYSWLLHSSMKLRGFVKEQPKHEFPELVLKPRTVHEQWSGHVPMPEDGPPSLGTIHYRSDEVLVDLMKPEDGRDIGPAQHLSITSHETNVTDAEYREVAHNATCDGCKKQIMGVRHICVECEDFDYCSNCVTGASNTHPNHQFEQFSRPEAYTASVTANHNALHAKIKKDVAAFSGSQEAKTLQRRIETKKDRPKPINVILDHPEDEQYKEKFMLFLILSGCEKTFHEGIVLVRADDGVRFHRVGFFSTKLKSAFDDADLLELELI